MEAHLKPGVHGIAGPNGSGKSTLMKCLSGLIRPDRGQVVWKLGDRKLDRNELTTRLGFSAPYVRLYEQFNCRENLMFILELTGRSRDAGDIEAVMESVGLAGKEEQFYGRLSSGQQQRLRLAAAGIKSPDFLLLDEPGTNLDKAGFYLLRQFVELHRNRGVLVLIASNETRELDLCSSVTDISDFK